MKKAYLSYGMVMMAYFIGHWGTAAIIVDDDFSTYTNGNLNGQSGSPTGLSGTWTATTDSTISGNTLQMSDSSGEGINASRGISANTALPSDVNSVYAAITFTIHGTINLDDSFSLSIRPPSSPTFWQFGFRDSAFSLNGGGLAGTISAETAYTLVSRLTRNDAGDDIATLWVDPTLETDSALITGFNNYLVGGETSLTQVVLSQTENDGDTLDITRITIGQTFNEVLPVPEPSALGLLFFGTALACLRKRRVTKS